MVHTHSDTAERTADAFEIAIIDYRGGKGSIDQVYRLAMPVFARLARSAAYRMGIPEEGDEIAQELGMIFFKEILRTYNPDLSIYPFLRTYAGNLARTHSRARLDNPNASDLFASKDSDGEFDPLRDYGLLIAGLDGREADDVTESVITSIDRANALKKISESLYPPTSRPGSGFRRDGSTREPLPPVGFFVEKSAEKPLRNPRVRSARPTCEPDPSATGGIGRQRATGDQIELREIRISLGMSQPEFAGEIGINVPRLSSYEYGKTVGVPAHVMAEARRVRDEYLQSRGNLHVKFARMKMSELVASWAAQITDALMLIGELPANAVSVDDSYLARTLQVTETTLRRWRNDRARPTVKVINAHSETVSFLVTRCKLQAEGKVGVQEEMPGWIE